MMVFIGIQKLHLQTEMDLLIYIIVAFFCRINPETHQFSELFFPILMFMYTWILRDSAHKDHMSSILAQLRLHRISIKNILVVFEENV